MKALLSILPTWLIVSNILVAQPSPIKLTPKVDLRIELLSIVFRLAGNYEYNNNEIKKYASNIESHFSVYKNHPVVLMAKELREKQLVSYDAVMSMAIHLEAPPSLKPIMQFTDLIPENRWGKEQAYKFVSLLQDFYKKAKCGSFFEAHKKLYKNAEERFLTVLTKLDLAWYKEFYGELPDGTFHLVLGMNNGPGNYGPKVIFPNGKEDIYGIIGAWKQDSLELPVFDESYLPTIIHEFNHSFINHLVDKNRTILEGPGEVIFKPVEKEMKASAYNRWDIMIKESLVRAAVINYYQTHGRDSARINRMIIKEQARGFVWIDELLNVYKIYADKRTLYPTFNSFMNVLISYFQELSGRIEIKNEAFSVKCARVLRIEPFPNGSQDVSPSITEIKIFVDKELMPERGYSISYGRGGANHFGVQGITSFGDDNKTLTVKLELKPDHEYSFVLTPYSFETRETYPLSRYEVYFKTAKE